jgi:hypothetical protein
MTLKGLHFSQNIITLDTLLVSQCHTLSVCVASIYAPSVDDTFSLDWDDCCTSYVVGGINKEYVLWAPVLSGKGNHWRLSIELFCLVSIHAGLDSRFLMYVMR